MLRPEPEPRRTPPQYKTCPQARPSRLRPLSFQRVAQLVFQRLSEDFVQKPDYALSSVGKTQGGTETQRRRQNYAQDRPRQTDLRRTLPLLWVWPESP